MLALATLIERAFVEQLCTVREGMQPMLQLVARVRCERGFLQARHRDTQLLSAQRYALEEALALGS